MDAGSDVLKTCWGGRWNGGYAKLYNEGRGEVLIYTGPPQFDPQPVANATRDDNVGLGGIVNAVGNLGEGMQPF